MAAKRRSTQTSFELTEALAALEILHFTITGEIIPAVRMTHRSKFADPKAQEYLANQDVIAWQLKIQMMDSSWELIPNGTRLAVEAEVSMPEIERKQDLDNILKAILDAAQGIVFQNDCWFDLMKISRVQGEEYKARLEVHEI